MSIRNHMILVLAGPDGSGFSRDKSCNGLEKLQ